MNKRFLALGIYASLALALAPWATAQQNGQLAGRRLILNDGGPATSTKNTITLEPPAAATLTGNYTLVFPAPAPTADAVLQVASVAGTTATLQWGTAGGATIFEQETAANGNIRRRTAYSSTLATGVGLYAFDAQGSRTLATQTASGQYSGILGGSGNTASANYSLVSGGQSNTASATHSAVLGGGSNSVSGIYSLVAGQSNSISGTHSFVFGYGAAVTQSNTIVFNHPTAGDGTTRVGIDNNNPNVGLDVDAAIAVRPPATVDILANAQTVSTVNRSYLVLNPAAANRTGTILSGVAATLQTGQILVLRVADAATGSVTIEDLVANNVNLTGDWVGAADDTITLIWSGTRWVELTRSNN